MNVSKNRTYIPQCLLANPRKNLMGENSDVTDPWILEASKLLLAKCTRQVRTHQRSQDTGSELCLYGKNRMPRPETLPRVLSKREAPGRDCDIDLYFGNRQDLGDSATGDWIIVDLLESFGANMWIFLASHGL